ncbi:hypothetical protein [Streptomyces collinus]|uniref:hypothetical protein n=1 Tax=Streptomyces collinus TaxID=42684 RepID=UPI00331A7882
MECIDPTDGPAVRPNGWPEHVRDATDAILRRLGTDHAGGGGLGQGTQFSSIDASGSTRWNWYRSTRHGAPSTTIPSLST